MVYRILFCTFSFFILISSIFCNSTPAKEDMFVSVEGLKFPEKNFFEFSGQGFSKDKVNFNKGWLGIFMENEKEKGISVMQITKGSPAAKAGIKAGDIITHLNGVSTIVRDGSNLIDFKKNIEKIGANGTPVLTILREGREISCKPRLDAKLLKTTPKPFNMQKLNNPEGVHQNQVFGEQSNGRLIQNSKIGKKVDSFIHFALENDSYKEMFQKTLQRIGEEVYVREGFQSNAKSNIYRLPVINYFMLNPADTYTTGHAIQHMFINKGGAGQICSAAWLLDIEFPVLTEKRPQEKVFPEHIQSVIEKIASCVSSVKEAFKDVSPEEYDFLYKNAPNVWLPHKEIEPKQLEHILELAKKVNMSRLFQASMLLCEKIDALEGCNLPETTPQIPPFTLPELLQCPDTTKTSHAHTKNINEFAGDILLIQDTSIGKIVIGGTGTSYYFADAAMIIDLGGDDFYFNNAGSSHKDMPVSICIDFSGNDTYDAPLPFSQGTGRFGIGMLRDIKGNDKYMGTDFLQGSCLFGLGQLVDYSGDDFYNGNTLNQGVGFFGLGQLNDISGNDVYFSHQYAQGVGFTRGIGLLMDKDGNDFYFSGGKYPDFRDPEKSYQSMSQGMGMGLRPEDSIAGASGGVGILLDSKGNDRYHGDYFSQGSGYYYSLGLLFDTEGNDSYFAGRYAQGAGIHSAIGLLADKKGNDTYVCSFGVAQGCGHDTGIGVLVDTQGNDLYQSEIVSQGVGLEKGIGILADFYGNDTYQTKGDNCQGISMPSKTEEINGIGMLVDNHGIRDIFRETIKTDHLLYRSDGGLVLNKAE